MHPAGELMICVLIVLAAMLWAGFMMSDALDDWYPRLRKPAWTPPTWAYGPVWITLYLTMALSAWLVWRSAGSLGGAAVPLAFFAVQLVLNALWPALFFHLRRMGLALAEILALLAAIAATIIAFDRVNQWAALMLLPYFLWTCLAAALNAAFLRLNRRRTPG